MDVKLNQTLEETLLSSESEMQRNNLLLKPLSSKKDKDKKKIYEQICTKIRSALEMMAMVFAGLFMAVAKKLCLSLWSIREPGEMRVLGGLGLSECLRPVGGGGSWVPTVHSAVLMTCFTCFISGGQDTTHCVSIKVPVQRWSHFVPPQHEHCQPA